MNLCNLDWAKKGLKRQVWGRPVVQRFQLANGAVQTTRAIPLDCALRLSLLRNIVRDEVEDADEEKRCWEDPDLLEMHPEELDDDEQTLSLYTAVGMLMNMLFESREATAAGVSPAGGEESVTIDECREKPVRRSDCRRRMRKRQHEENLQLDVVSLERLLESDSQKQLTKASQKHVERLRKKHAKLFEPRTYDPAAKPHVVDGVEIGFDVEEREDGIKHYKSPKPKRLGRAGEKRLAEEIEKLIQRGILVRAKSPRARELLAVRTPQGIFTYARAPMGAQSSPAELTELVDRLLAPFMFGEGAICAAYMDGVELRRFLGCMSASRDFIPRFSDIAAPLNDLLKKDLDWRRDKEQGMSFLRLRKALCSPPILRLPIAEATGFRLATEASDVAVGGVLEQLQPSDKDAEKLLWRVIGYYSRSLRGAERNYSAGDKELIALHQSLKHWGGLLRYAQTNIQVDNKALSYLLTKAESLRSPREWRLCEFLTEFDRGRRKARQAATLACCRGRERENPSMIVVMRPPIWPGRGPRYMGLNDYIDESGARREAASGG